MSRWFLIAALCISVHYEVTRGYSLIGCFLRGLYNIETGVCK